MSLDNASHNSTYIDITLTDFTVMILEYACHYSANVDKTLTASDRSTVMSLDNAMH